MPSNSPESILSRALRLGSGQRREFLDRACRGDASLRREIESLLDVHESFPHPESDEDAASRASGEPHSIEGRPGGAAEPPLERIGRFEILRQIGHGGMGQVLLGRDASLDRDVAIKILPRQFADDPERFRRFRREARILGQLNHPNIASVYAFEPDVRPPHLVLEYVPGRTLREHIGGRRLPADETITICLQIVQALEAAHEAGIIHRDLKPSNVVVRTDGVVKVLDFGLGKILSGATEGPEVPSRSSDLSGGTETERSDVSPAPFADASVTGHLVGSPGYSSPEQIRGDTCGPRSDIWSLGCILFECLSGRPAFSGSTPFARVGAVLDQEPDWTALPSDLPPSIHEVLRGCMVKPREQRIEHVGTVRAALLEARASLEAEASASAGETGDTARSAAGSDLSLERVGIAMNAPAGVAANAETVSRDKSTVSRDKSTVSRDQSTVSRDQSTVSRHKSGARPPRSLRSAAILSIVLAGLTLAGIQLVSDETHSRESPPSLSRLEARQLTFDGVATGPALSPDGRVLAYVHDEHELVFLDVEDRTRFHACRLGRMGRPVWSRDGNEVLFVGAEDAGSRILGTYLVARMDSVARQVGPEDFAGSSFSPDGRRIVGHVGRPVRTWAIFDRDSGKLAPFSPPATVAANAALEWSPRTDLLLACSPMPDSGRSVHIVSIGGESVLELPPVHGRRVFWSPNGDGVIYAEPGHVVRELPVDPRTGDPSGPARIVLDRYEGQYASIAGRDVQRIAYRNRASAPDLWWAERSEDGWTQAPVWRRLTQGGWRDGFCRISPDGERVAFVRRDEEADVFVVGIDSGRMERVTRSAAYERWPSWSPDGTRIAFCDSDGVWIVPADGGEPRLLQEADSADLLYWWPSDRVLFQPGPERHQNYACLDARPSTFPGLSRRAPPEASLLLPTTGSKTVFQIAVAPDRARVAVAGNRGPGHSFQTTLIDLASGEERTLYDGWAAPFAWSPDGTWVYLITNDPRWRDSPNSVVLRVNDADGRVERLFELPGRIRGWGSISMSEDGRRIVCATENPRSDVWVVDGVAL